MPNLSYPVTCKVYRNAIDILIGKLVTVCEGKEVNLSGDCIGCRRQPSTGSMFCPLCNDALKNWDTKAIQCLRN